MIPITEYRVFIQRVNGIDFDEPADCTGTDADVVANRLCRVEMATLRLAPFHLTQGDEVIAKV